jgi:flagellar hook protein FlgE
MQIGTGVTANSITNQFTQGSISSTGAPTDMAVNGNGFFVVKDSTTGQSYVTRDGTFSTDSSGFLITSNGMRVQGFSDAALTTQGSIKIDNTGAPLNADGSANTSAVARFSFDATGKLNVLLADGTQFTRGQVLLQNFSNPAQLLKVGNNLYEGLPAAGPLATPVAPSSSGLGSLVAGSLELSNVNLAVELTSLITTQRAYEANGKVITTSDDVLQTLINLKR